MRSKNGEAISDKGRTKIELRKLETLLRESKSRGDLRTWRRAKAVFEYIRENTVIAMSGELGVTRGSINRWLQWFEAEGTDGLKPRERIGPAPKLTEEQRQLLSNAIEAGPQAAGYDSGMWTGPMIGHWIELQLGVSYHNHHIPRLLHQLGFSVQRPRKRLARADVEKQEYWLRERLPAIKKRLPHVEG